LQRRHARDPFRSNQKWREVNNQKPDILVQIAKQYVRTKHAYQKQQSHSQIIQLLTTTGRKLTNTKNVKPYIQYLTELKKMN